MRDEKLLRVFLNYLHEAGALSVPPGDLKVAVEKVAERFSLVEDLHHILVVLKALEEDENAKK
jgi:hypothetical protein